RAPSSKRTFTSQRALRASRSRKAVDAIVPQCGQFLAAGAGATSGAVTIDSPCERDSGGAVPATRNPGVAMLAGASPENPSGNQPCVAAMPPRAATPTDKLATIRACRVRGDTSVQ